MRKPVESSGCLQCVPLPYLNYLGPALCRMMGKEKIKTQNTVVGRKQYSLRDLGRLRYKIPEKECRTFED